MITPTDAVKIGSAIANATLAECSKCVADDKGREHIRGVAYLAMGNLWFGVLPEKARAHFEYAFGNFLTACRWPG